MRLSGRQSPTGWSGGARCGPPRLGEELNQISTAPGHLGRAVASRAMAEVVADCDRLEIEVTF